MPAVSGEGSGGGGNMFASDRDLLAYEPRLFNEVSWAGQRVLESASGGTIDSSGLTLTVTGAKFLDWGVDTGWVVLAGDVPLEVSYRINQTQLSVSRPRASLDSAAIPTSAASGLSVKAASFMTQIGLAHAQVMRALGIEPGAVGVDGVGEENITNPRAVIEVEALGALHLIYAAASAMVGPGSVMWTKAQMYRERFIAARRRLAVEIDADGDGVSDQVRRVTVAFLVRV